MTTSPTVESQSKSNGSNILGAVLLAMISFASSEHFFGTTAAAVQVQYVDRNGKELTPEQVRAYIDKKQAPKRFEHAQLPYEPQYSDDEGQVVVARPSTVTSLNGRAVVSYGGGSSSRQFVSGYTKKNGTVVRAHFRSSANSSKSDNWSARGNRNPTTGRKGYRR